MLTNILNFFKELAATITWPMAVLIISFIFRKQLFLAIKALTRRIETADKVSVTKDGLTLENVAKQAKEAEEKAEEAQKDVQSLATTGGVGAKEVFDNIKRDKKLKEASKKTISASLHNIGDRVKEEMQVVPDHNDPQKNEWGGSPKNNNRELKATITALPGNIPLYRIELQVVSTNSFNPLTGKVLFHLHPTFPNSNQEVDVVNGKAMLSLLSYGSFTVGAEADNGTTRLELDLEEVDGVTEHFKNN